MSRAPFEVGDKVVVRMTVLAIDDKVGLVLARPEGAGEDASIWFEPKELVPDHLTPPAPTQNPLAPSD